MKDCKYISCILLLSVSLLGSCISSRHAGQSEPLPQSYYESTARDYFFMESLKMHNKGQFDAGMDLMSHCYDIDTAQAATCYNLAQYYMSLSDRSLLEKNRERVNLLLERAVRLEPENYWYRRLLALNYLRQNRLTDAVNQYEDMVRRFPGRTDLLLSLAELYDNAGEYEKELRVLTRFGKLEDAADELKFQRFACYLQMGELDSAYYEADNPAEVIDLLMNTTRDMIERAESQLDKIKCRSLLDVAMNFCDVVSKHEPQLVQAYKQKAIAYNWLGEGEKSFQTISLGIANVNDGKDKAQLYNLRGDLNHNLGHTKEMYSDYDSTLMHDPENISVLNNYAYFLSLEDRDLERALAMSGKTIESEPFSSTFLDTYAWILFRMKRYKESLEYMEKALRYLDSDNPEIYEHYGDVLYMCGEKEKALEYWHKAVQMNSESKTLDKKIREQKYLE